jgi:hypothetical protein
LRVTAAFRASATSAAAQVPSSSPPNRISSAAAQSSMMVVTAPIRVADSTVIERWMRLSVCHLNIIIRHSTDIRGRGPA